MGKSKKVPVPTTEITCVMSIVDSTCDRRAKATSDEASLSVVESVRSSLKRNIDSIIVADDAVDAKYKKESALDARVARVKEEIEATSARLTDLRGRVPLLANGIIGRENEVKVEVNLSSMVAVPEVDGTRQTVAFKGMKETLSKLEGDLTEVGREMPEKLESLQVSV